MLISTLGKGQLFGVIALNILKEEEELAAAQARLKENLKKKKKKNQKEEPKVPKEMP